MLDLFDVAEDLALLLCDGQQFASLDQRVDLLERLGQSGQAVGFVEQNSRTNCSSPPTLFSDLALPSSCWAASEARIPMVA